MTAIRKKITLTGVIIIYLLIMVYFFQITSAVAVPLSSEGQLRENTIEETRQQSFLGLHSTSEPEFSLIDTTFTPLGTGATQFSVTIKNNGDATPLGVVPISYETLWYSQPLANGGGALQESIVDLDLNGDGDKLDYFAITWFHNDTRKWDAIIGGVHAYSIYEGPMESPNRVRTYSLNGNPKLFQLGNKTHVLYMANDNYISIGLVDAVIRKHAGPNFELFVDPKLTASDFKINGESVETNFSVLELENYDRNSWWNNSIYIVPNTSSEIGSGDEVSYSCNLIPTNTSETGWTVTSEIGLIVNWSFDSVERFLWVPFWEDVTLTATPGATGSSIPGLTIFTILIPLAILTFRRRFRNKY